MWPIVQHDTMTIVLGGFIGLAIVFTAAVFWLLIQATDNASEQQSDANEALSAAFDTAVGLSEPPAIDAVHHVNDHVDGGPIFVVAIEFDLDTDHEPDRQTAYELAARAVRSVRSAFASDHVRSYDIVFRYGDASWGGLGSKPGRRIAVPPELADRLDREPSFDAAALQAAIETADNGDSEIPPVAWGEPLRYNGGGQSTVVAGSTAAITVTN